MDHKVSNPDVPPARECDPHGHAAILLVESLIHGLVAKDVLSVAEAVEIVDVATEVKAESDADDAVATAAGRASINLLQNISASLRFDLDDHAQPDTPG